MIEKRVEAKADGPSVSTSSASSASSVMQVKVKPNSRASTRTQSDDGTWLAQLIPFLIQCDTLLLLLAVLTHCLRRRA